MSIDFSNAQRAEVLTEAPTEALTGTTRDMTRETRTATTRV
jgi:hypothetical protein